MTRPGLANRVIGCAKNLSQEPKTSIHTVDEPSFLIEWDNGGDCGIRQAGPEWLGQTTKRGPCNDCKANGTWVQGENGKWVEAGQ
ncbi:hypothetical protein BR93DRAFT_488992 [Coniochaeta sp. PMI_546]|nr:hypothetical protein BR93DRAFT_488992 [Coniochaeta sp. PMI_546]